MKGEEKRSQKVKELANLIFKKSSVIVAGETGARVFSWSLLLILPLLTTLEDFGSIVLLISLETILSGLLLGSLDRVVLRLYNEAENKDRFFGSAVRLLGLWICLLGSVAILVLTLFQLPEEIFGIPLFPDFSLFILGIFAFSLHRFLLSFNRARREDLAFVNYRLFHQTAKMALCCSLIYLFRGSLAYSVSLLTATTVVLLIQLNANPLSARQGSAKKFSGVAIPIALPLVLHALAGEVLGKADRFLLQASFGPETVGSYGALYAVGSSVTFISGLVSLVVEPYVYRDIPRAEGLLRLLRFAILAVGGLFSAILLPVATIFYSSAIGLNEETAVRPLAYLLAGHLVLAYYLESNFRLVLIRSTAPIAVVTTMCACVSLTLNWFLIPSMGINGAAISTYFGYILLSVILYRISHNQNVSRSHPDTFAAFVPMLILFAIPFINGVCALTGSLLGISLISFGLLIQELRLVSRTVSGRQNF